MDFRLRGSSASLTPHWKTSKTALNRIPIQNFRNEEKNENIFYKIETGSDFHINPDSTGSNQDRVVDLNLDSPSTVKLEPLPVQPLKINSVRIEQSGPSFCLENRDLVEFAIKVETDPVSFILGIKRKD